MVMDNYGTQKSRTWQAWPEEASRVCCHFVPTSSSWHELVDALVFEN